MSWELQSDTTLVILLMQPHLEVCTALRALSELFKCAKGGIHITPSVPDVAGAHSNQNFFESLEVNPVVLTLSDLVTEMLTENAQAVFVTGKAMSQNTSKASPLLRLPFLLDFFILI